MRVASPVVPVALVALLALAACGPVLDPLEPDAAPDASPLDAPAPDASPLDAPDAPPLAPPADASPDTLLDASVPAMDAMDTTPDAPVLDASSVCRVDGAPGECIAVTACTGARVPVPGHCPGAATVQCCIARPDAGAVDASACDPAVHVLPDALRDEAPASDGCPDGMVRVAAFCIDRFECSLALVSADGSLAPWSPYFNPGALRVRARSVQGVVPQGYVSGVQAGAACREAGKRLCADAEWLRACQGPGDTVYPYGNTREPGVCNDARAVHPAIEYYGTSASWVYTMLDNACLDQLPSSLDRTGSNPGCTTREGAFDMMGNLHEWTADPAGTFRGGYFVDTMLNGNGCRYATTAHDAVYWDYSTGFRCCADP